MNVSPSRQLNNWTASPWWEKLPVSRFHEKQIIICEKKINTKVVRCETLRQIDGLALSSRNSKLSFSSKKIATNLFKALNFAKEKFNTLDVIEIQKKVIEQISAHSEIKLDYFIIADEQKLEPSISKKNQKYRAFIAAYISGVRLIDNIKLY